MLKCDIAIENYILDYLMVWKNVSDTLSENGKLQNNVTPIYEEKKSSNIYIENRLKKPKC